MRDSAKEAYGDLTKNLEELVQREGKESSRSNVLLGRGETVHGETQRVRLGERQRLG